MAAYYLLDTKINRMTENDVWNYVKMLQNFTPNGPGIIREIKDHSLTYGPNWTHPGYFACIQ